MPYVEPGIVHQLQQDSARLKPEPLILKVQLSLLCVRENEDDEVLEGPLDLISIVAVLEVPALCQKQVL